LFDWQKRWDVVLEFGAINNPFFSVKLVEEGHFRREYSKSPAMSDKLNA
jgi:hypothetical protein